MVPVWQAQDFGELRTRVQIEILDLLGNVAKADLGSIFCMVHEVVAPNSHAATAEVITDLLGRNIIAIETLTEDAHAGAPVNGMVSLIRTSGAAATRA